MSVPTRNRAVAFLAFGVVSLFCRVPIAGADVRVRAGLEIYETALRAGPEEWQLATSGLGTVTFEGVGSRNVRGEIALTVPADPVPALAVERAFIRFRLPWFRMTLGGAPLSWGEGILINAGDLPNPAYDPTADILSGDFRADPVWQVQLYVPMGPFSFVEVVALPPLADPATGTFPAFAEVRSGARAYVDADLVALQLGYLYEDPFHRFYTSLQGSLGVDLYLVLAHEIEAGIADPFEQVLDSITLSAGGFTSFDLGRDMVLAVRLEGEIVPQELEDGLPGAASLASTIDWTLGPTVNLGLQALLAPVDPSTLLAASVSWNVDQGLTLLSLVQANVGGSTAIFATDAYAGVTFTVGARYFY